MTPVLRVSRFGSVYDSQDRAVRDDPSLENAWVPPSNLEEYRHEHELRAPCCLCALMDNVPYTESRIGLAGAESSRAGTYVAECALNKCGYYVYLEDFYSLRGLRIRKYARRDIPILEGSTLPATRTAKRWVMKIGREGVSEQDFWLMIGQCPRCQWLLPKLELQTHGCTYGRRTEIDLTEEV
ncbi:hypothetical protein BKA70DRAFT_1441759 [Coprinopsis sp. MPI-PUGE-AT-0042]|nr:hypothetical protein BKA70DRAFT_1441759 [Coprinopsis sp. MPI-PUGE-AT-0042]